MSGRFPGGFLLEIFFTENGRRLVAFMFFYYAERVQLPLALIRPFYVQQLITVSFSDWQTGMLLVVK